MIADEVEDSASERHRGAVASAATSDMDSH